MPKKKPPPLRKGSRILALLSALANEGLYIGATFIAETAPYTIGRRSRKWKYEFIGSVPKIDLEDAFIRARERHRNLRAITEIRRRRFARLVKRNGKYMLEVTEEGHRRLVPYQLDLRGIAPQKPWDGKWRVVSFDIPERQKTQRDVLRMRLRNLGFLPLQKSVFVLPYPCADALDILIHHIGLRPFVTFFTAEDLGSHEAKALAHFRLRRPRR